MDTEHLNRREFTSRIAAGAAVPLIAAGTANDVAAQSRKTESARSPSSVEQMLELILQQHPDQRLDEAAIAEIREELESQLARRRG